VGRTDRGSSARRMAKEVPPTIRQGNLKSLNALLQCILNELGMRCGISTTRDLKTITSRIETEGLSFLTITLAAYGKDFQKSLDRGYAGNDLFLSFKKRGGLPHLFGGFLSQIFDPSSARLIDEPSIEAIRAVRQLTLMFAKMNMRCSHSRELAAFDRYIEIEKEVRRNDQLLSGQACKGAAEVSPHHALDDFARVGRVLWADLFSRIDSRLYGEIVVPKHGPGSTADGLRGNSKFLQRMWTTRLEDVFPHWEHIIPSESFLDRTDSVVLLPPGSEIPVKVILVPKTLKTPRVIAMEPSCMQYMQQGVRGIIEQEIARNDTVRSLISSEDQKPNQRLAMQGSFLGDLATLDLSDASDRVSNQHVRLLVANHKLLREALDATRSRKADVNGKVIRLAKYASMGSALCFPIEALVFMTCVFVGIEKDLNRRLTKADVKSYLGSVRAYGDDIIVPVKHVQSVIQALETFGARVNHDKSFWTGKFRESCGKDFYDGHDVSIVRLRSHLPESRLQIEELQSTVATRNLLFQAGYVDTVEWLDKRIEKLIPFPFVEPTSVLLGRQGYSPCQGSRLDPDTHTPLVKGVVVESILPASQLDDYGALLKWFLMSDNSLFSTNVLNQRRLADKDHLQFAGRPVSARIKNRWAPTR